MKCPVCETECGEKTHRCRKCGFNDVNKIFVNKDEANRWFHDVVVPYRSRQEKWAKTPEFTIKGTVLSKYIYHSGMDRKIQIPDGVTEIRSFAFRQAGRNLFSIVFPESLRIIRHDALNTLKSLRKICIPQNVELIESDAFNSVTHIYVMPENRNYYSSENCLINKATKTVICGWDKCIIPIDDVINTIGPSAFAKRPISGDYAIPMGIETISYDSFRGCNNMESIYIPSSVTNIGIRLDNANTSDDYDLFELSKQSNPFVSCKKLKHIDVDKSNNIYLSIDGTYILDKRSKTLVCALKNPFAFPNNNLGIRTIGSYSIMKNDDITIISSSVNEILSNSFTQYFNKPIFIPSSVKVIEAYAIDASKNYIYCEADNKPQMWNDKWYVGPLDDETSSEKAEYYHIKWGITKAQFINMELTGQWEI